MFGEKREVCETSADESVGLFREINGSLLFEHFHEKLSRKCQTLISFQFCFLPNQLLTFFIKNLAQISTHLTIFSYSSKFPQYLREET